MCCCPGVRPSWAPRDTQAPGINLMAPRAGLGKSHGPSPLPWPGTAHPQTGSTGSEPKQAHRSLKCNYCPSCQSDISHSQNIHLLNPRFSHFCSHWHYNPSSPRQRNPVISNRNGWEGRAQSLLLCQDTKDIQTRPKERLLPPLQLTPAPRGCSASSRAPGSGTGSSCPSVS